MKINLRVLGSPNPGQSFGRGGAFRSGSNGGVHLHPGKLGAAKTQITFVFAIWGSLLAGGGMCADVVFDFFGMFYVLNEK